MGADRQVVLPDCLSGLVEDYDGRVPGLVLGFDDDLVLVDSELVGGFLAEGDSFDEVVELDLTRDFDDGRRVVGIPFAEEVAMLDLVTVLEVERGAVGNVIVGLGDARILVYDAHFGHTADYDFLDGAVLAGLLDGPEFLEHQFAVVLGLD